MKNEEPELNIVDIAYDMEVMHNHYRVHDAVAKLDPEKLKAFLEFRFNFLREELDEGLQAIQDGNPEEIVDALVDLVVIAVGTADLFSVDFNKAWNEVYKANMNKKVGIKESRPNKFGLPDLIKPDGWIAPDHAGNTGLIDLCFEKNTQLRVE